MNERGGGDMGVVGVVGVVGESGVVVMLICMG